MNYEHPIRNVPICSCQRKKCSYLFILYYYIIIYIQQQTSWAYIPDPEPEKLDRTRPKNGGRRVKCAWKRAIQRGHHVDPITQSAEDNVIVCYKAVPRRWVWDRHVASPYWLRKARLGFHWIMRLVSLKSEGPTILPIIVVFLFFIVF